MLCILTSFRVLHAPQSWLKHFFSSTHQVVNQRKRVAKNWKKLFYFVHFRRFFLISGVKSLKKVKMNKKSWKRLKKCFDQNLESWSKYTTNVTTNMFSVQIVTVVVYQIVAVCRDSLTDQNVTVAKQNWSQYAPL